MKIQVQKKHIDGGKCKIPQKCMIAAAIKEADPHVSYVAVRTNGITITKRRADGGPGVRLHLMVPTHAARRIIQFDNGEKVTPFAFEAKLVDETVIPAVKPGDAIRDKAKLAKRRAARKKSGLTADPKYGRQQRIAGV